MTCTEKCSDFCYKLVFLNITNSMNNLTKSTNFDHINYKYLLFLKIRNSYTGHNHSFFKDIKLPISEFFLNILDYTQKRKNSEIYQLVIYKAIFWNKCLKCLLIYEILT